MDSNVITEVGLVTIALGHLKQIFFPHCIQRNEICFKPGNQRGTKRSYAKQVASQTQVASVLTAEAGSFQEPGQPWAPGRMWPLQEWEIRGYIWTAILGHSLSKENPGSGTILRRWDLTEHAQSILRNHVFYSC